MRMPQLHLRSFTQGIAGIEGLVFILGNLSVVAAVGFAYEMGSNLVPGSGVAVPQVEAPESDEGTREQTARDLDSYSIISSRNIFGAQPKQTAPTAKQEPVSTLKLRLVGTNVSSSGAPFAIIEDTSKREQDLFDLNQSVFKQAKLVEVLPESVKIERNGKIEVLVLSDGPSEGSAASGSGIETLNDDQTEFSVSESELEDALGNLPRLLSQARAVPYFRNGKSVGMRLFAIRRDSLYEKLGLKNGDIVKAVNDNSLSDPAQALKLFEQLKNERSIRVKLERGGQDTDLSYTID